VKKFKTKYLPIAFAMVLAAILFSSPCRAALVYPLNAVIDGPSFTPVMTSFGEVRFEENSSDSNRVDILVDLTGNGIHKVQSVYFNFDNNAIWDANPDFDTVGLGPKGGTIGVDEGKDSLKAGSYPGLFDLRIPEPPPGNLGFEPYMDTIFVASLDLEEGDFNALDTSGNFFVIVHIGNYGGSPGVPGGDSIWVGSVVPIPGSVLLLGSGLLGVIFLRRKRSVK